MLDIQFTRTYTWYIYPKPTLGNLAQHVHIDYEDIHLLKISYIVGVGFRSPTCATSNSCNLCIQYPNDMFLNMLESS